MFNCDPPQKIDREALTQELDSIFQLDQKYRATMISNHQELMIKQNAIDSANLVRIEEIIEEVGGYPGVSLVGVKASKVTFFVLQHASESIQDKYYDLIIEAAKNNELSKGLAAMYQDRYLVYKGKPQIFGTQIYTEHIEDSITGERRDTMYVWPIADTTKIDSVRMWNSLGPLEEYLNGYGLSRWD